jgi:ADP-ribose pyrophosphatase
VADEFRLVKSTPLFHSYVFDVERRVIEHQGEEFNRDVAAHRGAVAILAIDDNERVGFIRQYRAPFDEFSLEIPAGTMDVDGEETLETAKRELHEELGCEAATWRLLGRFKVSPGWTNQVMTIYEARDLTFVQRTPEGPEETSSSVEWVAVKDLRSFLRQEATLDYTMTVALHRVFGTFFDVD